MFKDRANKIDLLLMFAATFAITVAFWPRNSPLQVVRCLDQEANWKTYSIATDDPALAKLRDKLERWQRPELDPAYAQAKWRKELADRYHEEVAESFEPAPIPEVPVIEPVKPEATTARLSDTVTFASYEQDIEEDEASADVQLASLEEPEPAAAVSPSDANYWEHVRDEAEAIMQSTEEARAEPPIVFGPQLPAMLPKRAFHAALLFGILAACAYMHWLVRSPFQADNALRRQPKSVVARIIVFTAVNAFAFVSSAIVWF
ncbi:MAG: hypothetical protein AAFX06_07400 [Planctomycetota bacterium]